jgi:putative ABC transport system permease protein
VCYFFSSMLRRAFGRTLFHSPWFAAAAILTTALGIGTNAAIFSILNRIVFWPLPYTQPHELVWIASLHAERGQYAKSSGWDYASWAQRHSTFEAVGAYWDRPFTFTGTDRPEALSGWQFTPNLFSILGVNAALGRTFLPDDGQAGRDNVVVIGDALWRRRFNADPSIVGQAVELDGRTFTVIGVMPREFAHPFPGAQLWTPLPVSADLLADRKQRALRVIARLRDGVTREQATVELAALAQHQARDFADTHAGWGTAVRPIRDLYGASAPRLLWMLQCAALILLLIAASNVASLVLVRATGKQREFAVRAALGASRADLLRHQLAEGLTLAAVGGAAGLLLALWGTQTLAALLATQLAGFTLPETFAGWLDRRVLAATAVVTMAAGVAFGLVPAVRGVSGIPDALQSRGRGATGNRSTRVLRHAIVAGQIALSVSLLVGAGLLVRSFMSLQNRSFGFQTDHVVTAQLVLSRDRFAAPAQSTAFLEQLVANLAALPGVDAAGVINTLPLTGFNALRPYNLPGQAPQERFTEFRIVTPGYFRAMSIPVRRGRTFDDRDRAGAQEVVVVNETVAQRLWPGTDPVGRTLVLPDYLQPSPKIVIGVVGDTRHHDLSRTPEPEVYRSAYQAFWPFYGIVVRTQTDPALMERSIRDVAARLDRSVPISDVRPLDDLAARTWAWRRSSMAILALFAGAACLLAFVGVYGVMAYSVRQRSREIGVRLALGARPADVARLVLSQGTLLTGLGIAIGLAISAASARALSAWLFGVAPLDPMTFAVVVVVTGAAGLLASAVPAWSAARVDPTIALRAE